MDVENTLVKIIWSLAFEATVILVTSFIIALLLLVAVAYCEDFNVEINNQHEDYFPLQGQFNPETSDGSIDLRDDRGVDQGHVDILGGTATIYDQQGHYEGSITEPAPGTYQYDR